MIVPELSETKKQRKGGATYGKHIYSKIQYLHSARTRIDIHGASRDGAREECAQIIILLEDRKVDGHVSDDEVDRAGGHGRREDARNGDLRVLGAGGRVWVEVDGRHLKHVAGRAVDGQEKRQRGVGRNASDICLVLNVQGLSASDRPLGKLFFKNKSQHTCCSQ